MMNLPSKPCDNLPKRYHYVERPALGVFAVLSGSEPVLLLPSLANRLRTRIPES